MDEFDARFGGAFFRAKRAAQLALDDLTIVIPGRGRRPRARNPYSLIVVIDSGLLASLGPGMTTD
jgi:hypothetical protein